MKLFSSHGLVGTGLSLTAHTFSSNVLMPSPLTLCSRNSSSFLMKQHLSG